MCVTAPAASAATTAAQRALNTWTKAHPDTGAAVWRLDPGRTPVAVAEHNPDAPQLPASVMKLVTSAGALLTLGPGFQFETTIATSANAARNGATLRGTLFLKGGGDPVLATRRYAARYLEGRGGVFGRLPDALRADGVRLVRGPIVADETVFDGRRTGLQWRSYYAAYSPPLSGLSVNQNYQGELRARYVGNPPLGAAAQLRAVMRRDGIRHTGALRAGRMPASAVPVGTVRSPKLSVILRLMNHDSDNFVAETLRKNVGAYGGTSGTSEEGALVTVRLLTERGILSGRDRIVDGSGLSRANRVTAGTLVRLLAAADAEPDWGAALIDSLPRGGQGTLVRRFRQPAIRARVHAKTGYINGVSSLAGIAESPNGVRYAFAFLMNDWDIGGAKATQDRIVTMLASGAMDPAAQPAPLPAPAPVTTPPTSSRGASARR